ASNHIGDGTPAGRNVISGNVGSGVFVDSGTASAPNVIAGNYIGTDAGGLNPLGNDANGILVFLHALGTPIRGNVIADSRLAGVQLDTSGNVIAGNLIGTNASGTQALGHQARGILIEGPDNTIGGTTAADRNVVSGNDDAGILIIYEPAVGVAVTGNKVEGNYIRTDASGTVSVPNAHGVWIQNAANNTIGGATLGAGNVISGNSRTDGNGVGVYMFGAATTGNTVSGNYIGTDATGTFAVPND